MAKKKRVERRAGQLVIIGGAEDREGACEILREFARLAGGARARLVIISVASDAPQEVAQIYEKTFRRLGVRHASALDLRARAEANADEAVAAIDSATGVFFTGGNQLRITRLLGGTRLDTALHRRREEGLVVAGTSAGAAMSEGRPRDVGGKIVGMMFPEGDGRVPVVSVTGTNGKTTVTRMTGHVLASTGLCVGVTTTDGIWVGGRLIEKGDTTGPHSARAVLSDPTVEAAVLETARGGIMRRGLGYDWSDVGVITNIQPDHFGQDGIENLEDLVYVKSLVAERVRDGGTLVLNADDEQLARLAESPRVRAERKRVVYFSLRAEHVLIRKHLDAGGTAFFVRDGRVVEAAGAGRWDVLGLEDVPVTLGGTAEYQVANVLACVAACRARDVARAQIADALKTFRGAADNPGRTNIFRAPSGGQVVLDYGHNPEAFAAVCQTAARWRGLRVTGIVGVPGDRSDALVEQAARIAARGFARVLVKEDKDLRGRRPGEVADIIRRAVADEAPWRECAVVLDEEEALRRELGRLGAGDVLVMFYDKLEPLCRILREFGAEPVETIEGLAPRAAAAAATPSVVTQTADAEGTKPLVGVRRPRANSAHDRQGYNWR